MSSDCFSVIFFVDDDEVSITNEYQDTYACTNAGGNAHAQYYQSKENLSFVRSAIDIAIISLSSLSHNLRTFRCSSGWLSCFKERHGIVFRNVCVI